MPPTAEEVFFEIYERLIDNWTSIASLRRVTDMGLPYAEQALAGVNVGVVETTTTDPDYKNIIRDGGDKPLDEFVKAFGLQRLIQLLVEGMSRRRGQLGVRDPYPLLLLPLLAPAHRHASIVGTTAVDS